MQSGDEATKALRKQLSDLQEEYEQYKIKAKREFEDMQVSLTEKMKRELEQQKDKYEKLLDELRRNASSDKEFLQMELKKRITELEAEIERLKAEHAGDKETHSNMKVTVFIKYQKTVFFISLDKVQFLSNKNEGL